MMQESTVMNSKMAGDKSRKNSRDKKFDRQEKKQSDNKCYP